MSRAWLSRPRRRVAKRLHSDGRSLGPGRERYRGRSRDGVAPGTRVAPGRRKAGRIAAAQTPGPAVLPISPAWPPRKNYQISGLQCSCRKGRVLRLLQELLEFLL